MDPHKKILLEENTNRPNNTSPIPFMIITTNDNGSAHNPFVLHQIDASHQVREKRGHSKRRDAMWN